MMDPARLYTALLNTGLQQKDNPLYQVIYNLIGTVVQLRTSSSGSSGGSGSTGATGLTGPMGPPGIDGTDGLEGNEGSPGMQGIQGITGDAGPISPMGAIFPSDGDDTDFIPPIQGPQGNPGPTGSNGPVGPMFPLEDGLDGNDGSPGPSGTTGSSSGGGLTLLEEHTASSSATLDFTSFISVTYDEYIFEFINIIPDTNAVALWMRMSTDGGATYDTSGIYYWDALSFHEAASGLNGSQTDSKVVIGFSSSTTASYALNGSIRFFNPGSTIFKSLQGSTVGRVSNADAHLLQWIIAAVYKSTTAVNAVRFLDSSGSITSGTIRVYGVAKT